jgi:hypothetical protein
MVFMAIVALGSGAAGCAGLGETKTVTAPSSGGAQSAPPGAITYRGTTEQGLPISFDATSDAVVDLSFGWRARCADGKVRSNSIGLGGGAIHDGTFSFDGALQTGGVAQVEGKISGDHASGTFSRNGETAFGIDCAVADVAWQARADSGSGPTT